MVWILLHRVASISLELMIHLKFPFKSSKLERKNNIYFQFYSTLNWYGKGEILKEEPPRLNQFLQELKETEQAGGSLGCQLIVEGS